jgi:polysaccharide biosynthesis protein PelF
MSADRLRVCLLLEGTYPFITGGVSSWVHEIITGLPDIDFVLYTISPSKNQTVRYSLPPNVVGHKDVVITEPHRPSKTKRDVGGFVESALKMHYQTGTGGASDLSGLFSSMVPGWNPLREAILSNRAWSYIVQQYSLHNPMYPFADYFWAWRSSHEMMFTIISEKAPEADLYHAVSTGYAGLAASAAKMRTKKPFMLTEHGLYHKEREMEIRKASYLRGYQRDIWNNTYAGMSRIAYKSADLIISLFEFNRRKQIELGATKEKTIVVPNGIDVERFSSIVRKKRPGFSVGLIGRVVPIKDIRTFIAMCRVVADTLPDARFYCIGPEDEDPTYYEECRAMVEMLKLSEVFTFTGRQDVRDYYAFLDVILLTSVREAQPLVILEGYLSGVPTVATRVGNIPEMIGDDDRFLAFPKDVAKLASSVIYIHDHPDVMAGINEANRRKVIDSYNRASLIDTYRRMYNDVAGKDQVPGTTDDVEELESAEEAN